MKNGPKMLALMKNVPCSAGVCEADCFRHTGDLPDHPDWRLCQSRYCPLPQLLLVLGSGSWICKSVKKLPFLYIKYKCNYDETESYFKISEQINETGVSRRYFL